MFSYLTYSLSCSQNSWGLFILVIYWANDTIPGYFFFQNQPARGALLPPVYIFTEDQQYAISCLGAGKIISFTLCQCCSMAPEGTET
jgi:hypothetical protein